MSPPESVTGGLSDPVLPDDLAPAAPGHALHRVLVHEDRVQIVRGSEDGRSTVDVVVRTMPLEHALDLADVLHASKPAIRAAILARLHAREHELRGELERVARGIQSCKGGQS